ncbi:MAG: hypothetical protein F7O42_11940 [Opitutae bacterium]|nr:hypothetical protein [Opitutae bacterium]
MSSTIPKTPNAALLSRAADRVLEWPYKMWGFGEGIALRGLLAASRATGDARYRRFVYDLLRTFVDGDIGQRNEDHIAPGTELLLMYEENGDASFIEAAKSLAALNASFPKNRFGNSMRV